MAGRPCRPDADFKRLWRFLLPDTAFPACGSSEQSPAAPDDDEKSGDERSSERAAPAERNKG
jgi:hypothetical protein